MHLKLPSPGFLCYDCEDRNAKATFLAHVQHRVNSAADQAALSMIDELLGPAGRTVKSFYGMHDGVVMYVERIQRVSPHLSKLALRFFQFVSGATKPPNCGIAGWRWDVARRT